MKFGEQSPLCFIDKLSARLWRTNKPQSNSVRRHYMEKRSGLRPGKEDLPTRRKMFQAGKDIFVITVKANIRHGKARSLRIQRT